MSTTSRTAEPSTFHHILVARLTVVDHFLGDIKRLLWSYLPPIVPSIINVSTTTPIPCAVRPFDSDRDHHIYCVSRRDRRTVFRWSTLHSLPPLQPGQERPSDEDLTDVLFKLDAVPVLGCVYGSQLFYTVRGDPKKLRRRPVQRGIAAPTVVDLPEPVTQLQVASGALFFVAGRSYKLYMIDNPSARARQVDTLTKADADDSESIDDVGDEDDFGEETDSYTPEPIFQNAKIEDGEVTEILYIQGGTMGRLCYWRDGQASVLSPGVRTRMCRLVPHTKAGICCGFFGSSWDMSFYVYDMIEHRVVALSEMGIDLANEELISLSIDNNWVVTTVTSSRRSPNHHNPYQHHTGKLRLIELDYEDGTYSDDDAPLRFHFAGKDSEDDDDDSESPRSTTSSAMNYYLSDQYRWGPNYDSFYPQWALY
ncbi:hypothetical protein FOZ62_003345 [Perkinsus olseni]|uniref:Uncharacterized protein n=1 Tax=Perkinsus olseni TaxID=32597 RepID=A0A7J6QYJ8_PEROL|nr:hypothetical protein FOZ62_003345 [Perkinsus olseni]